MLCYAPWSVETNIARELGERGAALWQITSDSLHSLHIRNKPIQASEAAAGLEQLVQTGRPGDVLTQGAHTLYYYPNIQVMLVRAFYRQVTPVQVWLFLLYKVLHSALCWTGLARSSQAVTARQLGAAFATLLTLAILLIHCLLSSVGL